LPWRRAGWPVESADWETLTSACTPDLVHRHVQVRAAAERRRPTSAARIAVAAWIPVSTSTSATPTLIGGPPASPVMLCRPTKPCITAS
jgi:hypothetical protein